MQPEPDTIAANEEAKDRSSERRNFFLTTTLSLPSHGTLNARVRNLSTGGMMIELEAEPDLELDRGARLIAELRNVGRVKGEIAWVGGRRVGIKFDREIDPALVQKRSGPGEGTPDYIKPVLVPSRSLKYVEGLKGW